MLIYLIFSLFTGLAHADIHIKSECNLHQQLNISLANSQIQIITDQNLFQFELPENFLEVFESDYQQDLENPLIQQIQQPLQNHLYTYTLYLLETKNPKDKSLRIVIDSLTTFKKSNWWYFGSNQKPKERYEFFISLKSSGEVSRAAEISYAFDATLQDLKRVKDVTCEVTKQNLYSEYP